MIKKITLGLIILCCSSNLFAIEPYTANSGEIIFGFSEVDVNGVSQETGLRFSLFFHYGKQWHFDFNDNIGMYTGMDIRNIGFKVKHADTTDIYRSYALGVPLAMKLGSFDNHFFLYGGGEYELFFHYKHKRKTGSDKDKHSSWMSNRVNTFMPSLFFGIQFPKGINLKFTYYLDNFLNQDFQGEVFGETVDYGQWNTQVYYISLSFILKKGDVPNILKKADGEFVKL